VHISTVFLRLDHLESELSKPLFDRPAGIFLDGMWQEVGGCYACLIDRQSVGSFETINVRLHASSRK
jgi:hypothetical protein